MKLLDAQIDLINNIILQEINEIYDNFIKKALPHYTIQCDELWTFIGNKKNKVQ